MLKKRVRNLGKGELFKKWMSAIVALIFLLNTCSPAWAREGNWGRKSSLDMFASGALAGAVTAVNAFRDPIGTVVGGVVSDLAGLGMYYFAYYESGEQIKILGVDTGITKGQFYSMLAGITASAMAGIVAGAIDTAAQQAADTAAQQAADAATQTALNPYARLGAEFSLGNLGLAALQFAGDIAIGTTKLFFTEAIKHKLKEWGKEIKETLEGWGVDETIASVFEDETIIDIAAGLAGYIYGVFITPVVRMALGDLFLGKGNYGLDNQGGYLTKDEAAKLLEVQEASSETIDINGKKVFLKDLAGAKLINKDATQVDLSSATEEQIKNAIGIELKGTVIFLSPADSAKILIGIQNSVQSLEKLISSNEYKQLAKTAGSLLNDVHGKPITQQQDFVGAGVEAVRGLGLSPFVSTAVKITALMAMRYATHYGNDKERIFENTAKMAVADFFGNLSAGLVNNLDGLNAWYAGTDKNINPWQTRGGLNLGEYLWKESFTQLFLLGSQVGWAYFSKAANLEPGVIAELGHLAASSVIGGLWDVLRMDPGTVPKDHVIYYEENGELKSEILDKVKDDLVPVPGEDGSYILNGKKITITKLGDDEVLIKDQNDKLDKVNKSKFAPETTYQVGVTYQLGENQKVTLMAMGKPTPAQVGEKEIPTYSLDVDVSKTLTDIFYNSRNLGTLIIGIGENFNNYFLQAAVRSATWSYPAFTPGTGLVGFMAQQQAQEAMAQYISGIMQGASPIDLIAGRLAGNLNALANQNLAESFGATFSNPFLRQEYRSYATFIPVSERLKQEREKLAGEKEEKEKALSAIDDLAGIIEEADNLTEQIASLQTQVETLQDSRKTKSLERTVNALKSKSERRAQLEALLQERNDSVKLKERKAELYNQIRASQAEIRLSKKLGETEALPEMQNELQAKKELAAKVQVLLESQETKSSILREASKLRLITDREIYQKPEEAEKRLFVRAAEISDTNKKLNNLAEQISSVVSDIRYARHLGETDLLNDKIKKLTSLQQARNESQMFLEKNNLTPKVNAGLEKEINTYDKQIQTVDRAINTLGITGSLPIIGAFSQLVALSNVAIAKKGTFGLNDLVMGGIVDYQVNRTYNISKPLSDYTKEGLEEFISEMSQKLGLRKATMETVLQALKDGGYEQLISNYSFSVAGIYQGNQTYGNAAILTASGVQPVLKTELKGVIENNPRLMVTTDPGRSDLKDLTSEKLEEKATSLKAGLAKLDAQDEEKATSLKAELDAVTTYIQIDSITKLRNENPWLKNFTYLPGDKNKPEEVKAAMEEILRGKTVYSGYGLLSSTTVDQFGRAVETSTYLPQFSGGKWQTAVKEDITTKHYYGPFGLLFSKTTDYSQIGLPTNWDKTEVYSPEQKQKVEIPGEPTYVEREQQIAGEDKINFVLGDYDYLRKEGEREPWGKKLLAAREKGERLEDYGITALPRDDKELNEKINKLYENPDFSKELDGLSRELWTSVANQKKAPIAAEIKEKEQQIAQLKSEIDNLKKSLPPEGTRGYIERSQPINKREAEIASLESARDELNVALNNIKVGNTDLGKGLRDTPWGLTLLGMIALGKTANGKTWADLSHQEKLGIFGGSVGISRLLPAGLYRDDGAQQDYRTLIIGEGKATASTTSYEKPITGIDADSMPATGDSSFKRIYLPVVLTKGESVTVYSLEKISDGTPKTIEIDLPRVVTGYQYRPLSVGPNTSYEMNLYSTGQGQSPYAGPTHKLNFSDINSGPALQSNLQYSLPENALEQQVTGMVGSLAQAKFERDKLQEELNKEISLLRAEMRLAEKSGEMEALPEMKEELQVKREQLAVLQGQDSAKLNAIKVELNQQISSLLSDIREARHLGETDLLKTMMEELNSKSQERKKINAIQESQARFETQKNQLTAFLVDIGIPQENVDVDKFINGPGLTEEAFNTALNNIRSQRDILAQPVKDLTAKQELLRQLRLKLEDAFMYNNNDIGDIQKQISDTTESIRDLTVKAENNAASLQQLDIYINRKDIALRDWAVNRVADPDKKIVTPLLQKKQEEIKQKLSENFSNLKQVQFFELKRIGDKVIFMPQLSIGASYTFSSPDTNKVVGEHLRSGIIDRYDYNNDAILSSIKQAQNEAHNKGNEVLYEFLGGVSVEPSLKDGTTFVLETKNANNLSAFYNRFTTIYLPEYKNLFPSELARLSQGPGSTEIIAKSDLTE